MKRIQIALDTIHTLNNQFSHLPPGRRYKSLTFRIKRAMSSPLPKSIRLINSWANLFIYLLYLYTFNLIILNGFKLSLVVLVWCLLCVCVWLHVVYALLHKWSSIDKGILNFNLNRIVLIVQCLRPFPPVWKNFVGNKNA